LSSNREIKSAHRQDFGVLVNVDGLSVTQAGRLYGAALLLCACARFAAGQQPPAPAPCPLAIPTYIEQIDRWSADLAAAKDHPQELVHLRQEVPPYWLVQSDTAAVKVPADWLRTGLELASDNADAREEEIEDLQLHLQAMRKEARALATGLPPDSSAPGKLRGILARPEFRQAQGLNRVERAMERFRRWLADLLSRLTSRLAGHERMIRIVGLVPWAVLIIAVGILLAWMARRLLKRSPVRGLRLNPSETPLAPSCQLLTQAARQAAAAGSYRDAIRLAYLAAIYRLEDLHFWTVDPARTHREYLRLVRRDQAEHEPLARLTREFELAWYGARQVTQNDSITALAQLERLGCA